MFYLLKVFFKDPWVLIPLVVTAVSQLFMWPYFFYELGSGRDILFLHYNIIFGVDLVGEWWRMLFLPLGGLVIFLVNYSLALLFYNTDKTAARILAVFAAVFALFVAWAVYLTVDINL